MPKFIDDFLNRTTMYRVALYYLLLLLGAAITLGAFGLLPYSPLSIIASTTIILAFSYVINAALAKIFEIPASTDSTYITALILALIISPVNIADLWTLGGLPFLAWISIWAMSSKYILAIRRKHIFNPAALGVALSAMLLLRGASWWVGTSTMFPFVFLGGILVVRKILRGDLVLSFFTGAAVSILIPAILSGADPARAISRILFETPIFFFAFAMLTEPLTTPPTKSLRIMYGFLTGILFSPNIHLGSLYSTPELALLAGNIYSYLISPKSKYLLTLKAKEKITPDVYDFVFVPDRNVAFRAGQYLEWTVAGEKMDTRGNRRYFTIASAPSEAEVRLGVKFYEKPSTFKTKLLNMKEGEKVLAGGLAGDFTLPKDASRKLVFIAGGIGITPFRSMALEMLFQREKRDAVLFYANRKKEDAAYKEIFDRAEEFGLRTVYLLANETEAPENWNARLGFLTPEIVKQEVPDYAQRTFYISGPHSMVVAFEKALKEIGVPADRIKADFFPGFA